VNPPEGPSIIGSEEDGPNTLKLDPESVRDMLLSDNTSLRSQANRVLRARDQVNIARANLLPQINLGALLYASSPMFMVSAVSYLLPFLMPGNWFEVFKQKDLYKADKVAFKLARLNTYASAYSLYHSILTDNLARQSMAEDVADLRQIEKIILVRTQTGGAQPGDLENVQGQRSFAEARLHKMDALLVDELAAMRFTLALSLDRDIRVTPDEVDVSMLEQLPLQTAVDRVVEVAPEAVQLQYLIRAAKWDKWQRIFGFLSTPTASSVAGADEPASFTSLRVTGGLSFGLGYFPTIKLSERNMTDLRIREDEMHLEFARLLETTTLQLDEAKARVTNTQDAEVALRKAYQAKLLGYHWGSNDLLELMDARTKLREATLEKTRAISEVNMLRITLHRAMMSSRFERVKDCNDLPDEATHGFRWPWQPRVRPSDVHPGDCHAFTVNGRS
jgi:outer membrane protein TolC